MKSYESMALINASPELIWSILTDAHGYTQWESGVVRLEGQIALGQALKVTSEANPNRAFPLKVTELITDTRMVWTGGMPLGLFKGVRTFTLSPEPDSMTRFRMREEYTGPLLPLIWGSMPDLQPSFDKFAQGLKSRAERAGVS
ncbi:MAG: SRPBCC family protein [Chloroflexota bacterium]